MKLLLITAGAVVAFAGFIVLLGYVSSRMCDVVDESCCHHCRGDQS